MKEFLITILALFTVNFIYSQNNDVITLKDGTVYKGTLSEYNPKENTVMVLADGRTITTASTDINKITEKNHKIFIRPKQRGYFHTSSIGFLLGTGTYQNQVNFQYNMINGYQHKSLYIGAGTGVETMKDQMLCPIFLETSYALGKKRCQPFISGALGRVYNFSADDSGRQDLGYYNQEYDRGNMAVVSFGLKTQNTDGLSFICSAGYRYYDLKGSFNNREWDGLSWIQYPVKTNTYTHRFNLKIGILFN